MYYYEVLPADGRYRGDKPLTYSFEGELKALAVVTIPLRQRMVSGFVVRKVKKPAFTVKTVKAVLSDQPLPSYCLELAKWLQVYYATTLGESLKQFAPTKPSLKQAKPPESLPTSSAFQMTLDSPLTEDQSKAIENISASTSTTILLHGETGTGKTRVYIELAKECLEKGQSVILLTPEIALTSQLAAATEVLHSPTFVLHSQLSASDRKKIWLAILEAKEPVVIIGARSALFSPVRNLGLIVLDEAHEPAYKQEQSPRYHATRVASQLGVLTGAKVILGTATPSVADYYLADKRGAIVRMTKPALGPKYTKVKSEVVDLRDRQNFGSNPFISKQLIDAIKTTIAAKKQVMIYLNRRGTARLILCRVCGWQLICPNCDIPLVYHGDEHLARCHICGFCKSPPTSCPKCGNTDIIYKSIGTKALTETLAGLFQQNSVQRFDSDNVAGERINELYSKLQRGEIDILVGTQLLAKGFDLPKLGLVGIISAETSLALPDFTAEERAFQLLYQIIGRVGRGHGHGQVLIQTYNPDSTVIRSALKRDYRQFYDYALKERQQYRFPPFSYLLQLTCRRTSPKGAEAAASKLKSELQSQKLPVEIIGPTPNFYARRGRYYYWQLVVKSKDRGRLLELIKIVPSDWTVNLDPVDLL